MQRAVATGGPRRIVSTTEIASYSANVISEGEPSELAATVWLYRADGSVIAFLRFYHGGSAMAPSQFRQDLNAALVSYPSDALAPVVDVFRNETPLYFTWFDYSAQVPGRFFGSLGTSREPGRGRGVTPPPRGELWGASRAGAPHVSSRCQCGGEDLFA